jgi:hypothetical protein
MIVHGSHGGGNCVLFPETLMEVARREERARGEDSPGEGARLGLGRGHSDRAQSRIRLRVTAVR